MTKVYQWQKIINDVGEKNDMKSNWIKRTEYYLAADKSDMTS